MFRPCLLLIWCVFSTSHFLAPTPALAQPALPAEQFHPDMIKDAAKARFEASVATRRELAKARRDASEVCFQERFKLYRAGATEPGIGRPVTLALLLEAVAELAQAELALSDKLADRSAIRAYHWLYTWETERITEAQYRRARVGRVALMQARSLRLTEEIKLLEMLGDEKRSAPFLMLPAFLDGDENYPEEGVKELAKAQFETSQAKIRALAKARLDALQAYFQERRRLYAEGSNEPGTGMPITLDILLNAWVELSETELALSNKPADRLAVWMNRWQAAWRTDQLSDTHTR